MHNTDNIYEDYKPISDKRFAEVLKKHANHEIWHTCKNCGAEYDMRIFGYTCPICEHEIEK